MQQELNIAGIPNLLNPEADRICGGQPGPEELGTAADSGVGCIINLRPESEDAGFDEPTKVETLGMAYHVLGIAGPEDLSVDNARKLDELLEQHANTKTLVHCASGNRVGALMALRAAWLQDKPKAEAMDIGRQWGLTKLEPMVSQLLD